MRKFIIVGVVAAMSLFAVSCGNGGPKKAGNVEPAVAGIGAAGLVILSDKVSSDGTRSISAKPSGVCSSQIDAVVKDGAIVSVKFTGGCPGNTQGVAKLAAGMTVEDAISELEGIDCAGKGTSCPDQLTKVLKLFLE